MAWKTKATKGQGEFERPPAGNHLARLIGMFDLGTQEQEYGGEVKELHRVQWVWELLNEKKADGTNHVIGIELTWSLNEKAKMRKFIESRTGKSIPEGSEYDIIQELGQACLLNVVQNGEYVNVDGVSAVPKGMTCPKAERTAVALELDELKAGATIPSWAPYIYGKSPTDVAGQAKEFAGMASPTDRRVDEAKETKSEAKSSPGRKGPPPRKSVMEPNYYLSVNEDADPVLLPMSRLKELVIEKGDEALTYQVCPDGGEKWEPMGEAIPESKQWGPPY